MLELPAGLTRLVVGYAVIAAGVAAAVWMEMPYVRLFKPLAKSGQAAVGTPVIV